MLKKSSLLLLSSLALFAQDAVVFSKAPIYTQPQVNSEKIGDYQRKDKIEILEIIKNPTKKYDWYKTDKGYVSAYYVTKDIRFSIATKLNARTKPSVTAKKNSFYLQGEKVAVVKEEQDSLGRTWALTPRGWVSAAYLSKNEYKASKPKVEKEPTYNQEYIEELKAIKASKINRITNFSQKQKDKSTEE